MLNIAYFMYVALPCFCVLFGHSPMTAGMPGLLKSALRSLAVKLQNASPSHKHHDSLKRHSVCAPQQEPSPIYGALV